MCRAVFVAVRRLRFGYLIQTVAGAMSEAVAMEHLTRLAEFAWVSGCPEEAAEIMEDVQAMREDEPWKPTQS